MSNTPNIPPRFTYARAEHLKSRKAIEQLFKTGQSFFVYPYKVVYQFVSPEAGKTESPKDEQTILPSSNTAQHLIASGEQSSSGLSVLSTFGLLSGFAASSRNFKHAVDRNRIKRLGREAYRLNKHSLIEQLTVNQLKMEVFFIFTDKKLPAWKTIEPQMKACLKKLVHLTKKHHEKLLQG